MPPPGPVPAHAGSVALAQATRYLVCVPGGGFADNVKVISRCLAYARAHGRLLVVDTRHGKLQVDLSEYFRVHGDAPMVVDTPIGPDSGLNTLACHPPGITGRLHDVRLAGEWRSGQFVHIDRVSGEVLSFDFDSDHAAPLLYHSWYGEHTDFSAMASLAFTEPLRRHIAARLATLPPVYDAIHLRCTDKRVDHAGFLDAVRQRLTADTVLVCTDHLGVLHEAVRVLGAQRVVSLSAPPDVGGLPLHQAGTIRRHRLDRRALHRDMFCDLIGLASSQALWFPDTSTMAGADTATAHALGPSGFSELAAHLKHHPEVLGRLMGRELPPVADLTRSHEVDPSDAVGRTAPPGRRELPGPTPA